tara:strand:+ start:215 stop:910 length:696 start_codon:yes stop_codon:yes gene_type:complete
MKKIFVTGFPHTGTTIVTEKIHECSGIYKQNIETMDLQENPKNSEGVVWKFPALPPSLKNGGFINKANTLYSDVDIIFLIRNPYYVFSSMERAGVNPFTFTNHTIYDYLKTAERFLQAVQSNYPKVHPIRYEDLFEDDSKNLKSIFDKIGLTYNDLEGKTKDYLHQWVGKVPKEKPSETNRELFRTWQINQKFKNMNDPIKVNLSTELEKILDESFLVKVLGYENPKNKIK